MLLPVNASGCVTAAKPGPAGQGKIRRLEARGNVVVTQKEQTATGDTGIFDMAENTVTLNGNVIVSQGTNGTLPSRVAAVSEKALTVPPRICGTAVVA